MRLREAAGEINRARTVYVWMWLDDEHGLWVEVTKVSAKEGILEHCRKNGIDDVNVRVSHKDVYFSSESDDVEATAAAAPAAAAPAVAAAAEPDEEDDEEEEEVGAEEEEEEELVDLPCGAYFDPERDGDGDATVAPMGAKHSLVEKEIADHLGIDEDNVIIGSVQGTDDDDDEWFYVTIEDGSS